MYNRIKNHLPTKCRSMINILKNNKKLTKLPYHIFCKLKYSQRIKLYGQFADYLIYRGGFARIRAKLNARYSRNDSNWNFNRNINSNDDNSHKCYQCCAQIMYGVDATNLSQRFSVKNAKFDKIYLNNPHNHFMPPESGKIGELIVKPFFMSAKNHQNVGGKILIAIPYPNHANVKKILIQKEHILILMLNSLKNMVMVCMKQVKLQIINLFKKEDLVQDNILDMNIVVLMIIQHKLQVK